MRKASFTVILFTTVFFACNKEELVSSKDKHLLSSAEIQEIGKVHNEALEYVFQTLPDVSDLKNKENNEDIKVSIKAHLNEYYQTVFKNDDLNEIRNLSNQEIDISFNEKEQYYSKNKSGHTSSMSLMIEENKENLSEEQIKYLKETELIFENSDNIEDIIKGVDNLKVSVQNNLTKEEAQVILITLSIGENSAIYWNDNYLKWESKLSGSQTKSWGEWWDSCKTVMLDDAIAGGSTAAAIWVVNAIPVGGQIAYGSAVTIAAVAGSVGGAAVRIRNSINESSSQAIKR